MYHGDGDEDDGGEMMMMMAGTFFLKAIPR